MFQDLPEDYLYENIEKYDTVKIIDGEYKDQIGELGFIDIDNMCTIICDNNEKIIRTPITNLLKI
jgi:transcription elongation factor